MTIAEFVKEQVEARARAAATLKEPLEINGIEIKKGCSSGIELKEGIEKLAKILGISTTAETTEGYENSLYNRVKISFEYLDVLFYQYNYVPKGDDDV